MDDNWQASQFAFIKQIQEMGVVCSKKQVQGEGEEGGEAEDPSSPTKSHNTIEERISEIKEFLSLQSEDAQQIIYKQDCQRITITDFEIKQYLAKGGFGKVYTAVYRETGRTYAMKIISKSALLQEQIKMQTITQRFILENLTHPFLVKLHFAFHSASKIFMLVDYVDRGELFYIMRCRGKFTEDEARFFAAEIFLAVEYLHAKNIMYRDLKPENVLLGSDGHIKITDFGISKVFSKNVDVKTFSMCGTPQYIAPEVLRRKGYSFSSDWFSLGALIFDMLTGKPPFYSKNAVEIVQKKLEKGSVSIPRKLSAEARSLLKGLLNFNPQQRLGAKGSEQIRNHPFFAKINLQDVAQKKVQPPASIMQALNTLNIDLIAENKSSTIKSSMLAKTFRSKLSKELRNTGFDYNKYDGKQLTSYFDEESMIPQKEFDDEG